MAVVASPRKGEIAEKVSVLGLPISVGVTERDIIDRMGVALSSQMCQLHTFVNPHCYYIGRHDEEFRNDLWQFDGVYCDGIGYVLASRLLGVGGVKRFSFDTTSVAIPVLEHAIQNGVPVFLIGGRDGVADAAGRALQEGLGQLEIVGTVHGFERDWDSVADRICRSGARLVICGMGAPFQERFLLHLRRFGWVGVGFTCGGFFDQVAQSFHYYPRIVNALNLRFLYRLYKEPRRLAKRYLMEYPLFVAAALTARKR